MTTANNETSWFDRLALAAGRRTPRRQQVYGAARATAGHPEQLTSPGNAAATLDPALTRRNALRLLAGAVTTFIAADIAFPRTANASPKVAADCLSDCLNSHYEQYKSDVLYCTFNPGTAKHGALWLFPCYIVAEERAFHWAFYGCYDACQPPPATTTPPPPPPATTAPAPPGSDCGSMGTVDECVACCNYDEECSCGCYDENWCGCYCAPDACDPNAC
jgi:hypothetical protein